MAGKHTPGPWRYEKSANGASMYCSIWSDGMDDADSNIARTFRPSAIKDGEVEANARLIAAAPGVAEKAKALVDWLKGYSEPDATTKKLTDALIAELKKAGVE